MSNLASKLRIIDRQRELLHGAEEFTYKELVGGGGLNLFAYSPPGVSGDAPAIVFFFGAGFWERGELSQFAPQCLHFAERGMVAILADYRLGQEHGATPMDGVEDAQDAVAWIRANARRLGIDPARVVLAGASSGAHVSLVATLVPGGGPDPDPAALVMFSPIVNVLRDSLLGRFTDRRSAKLASPLYQVRKGLPPVLIFHGGEDRLQGLGDVESFSKKMARKKNRCELNVFKGERSSYFNFNVNAGLYEATLNMTDNFLVSVGVLEGVTDGGATTRLDSWR
jgi:acetyl esterase/lipase